VVGHVGNSVISLLAQKISDRTTRPISTLFSCSQQVILNAPLLQDWQPYFTLEVAVLASRNTFLTQLDCASAVTVQQDTANKYKLKKCFNLQQHLIDDPQYLQLSVTASP
jgi:hypothetical protein